MTLPWINGLTRNEDGMRIARDRIFPRNVECRRRVAKNVRTWSKELFAMLKVNPLAAGQQLI